MKFKERAQKSRNTLFSCFMKKVVLVILGVLLALVILAIMGFLFCYSYYQKEIGPVNKECTKKVNFEVKEGDNFYSIAPRLKEMDLINSEKIYKIYLKLNQPSDLKTGIYQLDSCLSVEDIIEVLQGKGVSTDIVITFKEGKNMRDFAKVIADNTNNSENDVYSLLKDETYLKQIIAKYWFLDESILNKNIYYSLEGYLYPNTYNFKNKDVTVKEIFNTLLDETDKQLTPYKSAFTSNKYSIHEILTLASIVELEASTNYQPKVASVFYNRLAKKMSLGSDVTTYYGAKVNMADRDLYQAELDAVNAYNTRPLSMAGKLPVGPICNPSVTAIKATLYPAKTNYLFFVADNKGVVYFTNTNAEHEQTIARLQKEGLWNRY